MAGGFVTSQIRRTSINLLMTCGIGMLALAALAAACDDYLYNVFMGPFPAAQETLAQGPHDPRQQFLQVQFERLLPTDTGRIKTVNGVRTKEIISRFYVAAAGDGKVMLVEVANGQRSSVLKGELKPIDDKVRTNVLPLLEVQYPGIGSRLTPNMFIARDYRSAAYVGLTVCGFIGVACAAGVFVAMRRLSDPQSHPAFRSLQQMGDPAALSAELEAELDAGAKVLGSCRFTQNWVIYRAAFQFQLMRLSELVWMYQRIVKHYHNGIPTGKSHFAVLCDRHGGKIQLSIRPKMAEPLLVGLHRMAPWAAVGFNQELARMWKRDRSALAAMADARRAALATKPPAPSIAA